MRGEKTAKASNFIFTVIKQKVEGIKCSKIMKIKISLKYKNRKLLEGRKNLSKNKLNRTKILQFSTTTPKQSSSSKVQKEANF